MRLKTLLATAAAGVAVLAPAAPAAAADLEQDICVTTIHHVGELCTSDVGPLAQRLASCVTDATSVEAVEACVPRVWPWGPEIPDTEPAIAGTEAVECTKNAVAQGVRNYLQGTP